MAGGKSLFLPSMAQQVMGNGICSAEGREEGLHPLLGLLRANQLHSSAGGTSKAQVIPQQSPWDSYGCLRGLEVGQIKGSPLTKESLW